MLFREEPRSHGRIDVGTAAGTLGLAAARQPPLLDVTQVELLATGVSLGCSVVGATGARAQLLRRRAEPVEPGGERIDLAVARAALEPEAWLRLRLQRGEAPGAGRGASRPPAGAPGRSGPGGRQVRAR